MPRLRRAAREKRARRQLDSAVWEWLQAGRPEIDHEGNLKLAWDVYGLETAAIHWHWPNDHEISHVDLFWHVLKRKVLSGEIEVCDVQHKFFNETDFVSQQEALEEANRRLQSRKVKHFG
jgi:hypothetical protein